MLWHLLADVALLAHLGFVVFAVFGGFFAWRYRPVLFVHAPALVWAAWIELSGRICPLTPLENYLRGRAGLSGYGGGFIEHYLVPLLYPLGLTRVLQWELAAVLLAVNTLAYGVILVRLTHPRRVA